jgi:hypothetical protein
LMEMAIDGLVVLYMPSWAVRASASNTTSCYPVYWTPPGYTAPIMDWFVKYADSEVSVDDTTGGNEEEIT